MGKSDGMSRLEADLKQKEDAIEKLKGEAKEYKATLMSCKDKLQESQKAIESNQRVIAYLNKQLNDNQMGGNMFASQQQQPLQQTTSAMNVTRSKYTSPYLNKMVPSTSAVPMSSSLSMSRDTTNNSKSSIVGGGGGQGMSGLSGLGTTISPILRNRTENRPTPPSSYFPQ